MEGIAMTIWVDANGWPVPPLLLLGCLIAETLYFRGWCVLVKKALVRSTNARAMSSSVLIGSISGEYQWNAWLWRWPALYDFALTNNFIHDWGEHTTFLLVSILFWSQVIPCVPLRPRTGYIGRMGCIGVAIVQNIIFAAVIGFAQVPLYAPYI